MAGKRAGADPVEDQLREFEEATPPARPVNLGNFPDDLDKTMPDGLRVERPEPEPEEPEPPDAAPLPERSEAERIADLETRIAARERELEFLRLGGQQQPIPQGPPTAQDAVGLIDQMLGGYRITPEDVTAIVS